VEELGAGSRPEGVEAFPESALELVGSHDTGFGLAHVWGSGDRTLGSATWTDEQCRTITVALTAPVGDLPAGPRLGEWVVTINAAGQCGNGILGDARCLRYAARADNLTLWVVMIGVDRSQGDEVVLSIPV
jgi:hypothetical protein